MFMVKDEFTNVKNLLKVKLKINGRTIFISFTVAAVIFLGSLITTVSGILLEDTLNLVHFQVMDFSITFLVIVFFMYITRMLAYKKINDVLTVFPQTNNSRFIATQIIGYLFMTAVALCALVFHLVYYGIIKLLSVFNDNIHLVINFDIGFIIVGLFVYLAYAFLLIGAIELIGTILRKWKHYAAVTLAAFVSLALVNIVTFLEYFPRVLSFLMGEPSVLLFMLKAAGIWLALVGLSLIINRFTVYHKSKVLAKTKHVFIICVAVGVMILIVLPLTIVSNTTSYTTEIAVAVRPFNEFPEESSITPIDISHLPRGSNLTLITSENITTDIGIENGAIITSRNHLAFVSTHGALTDIQGDTLIIEFQPPFFDVNGFELAGYMNPILNAYLVGDTLHIDYSIENSRVVIMPTWGIARQFDIFRDRGLFSEGLVWNSMGGSMIANIFIWVE